MPEDGVVEGVEDVMPVVGEGERMDDSVEVEYHHCCEEGDCGVGCGKCESPQSREFGNWRGCEEVAGGFDSVLDERQGRDDQQWPGEECDKGPDVEHLW